MQIPAASVCFPRARQKWIYWREKYNRLNESFAFLFALYPVVIVFSELLSAKYNIVV